MSDVDWFQLLDLPRRADLDEGEIQDRHHAAIAESHPDKATNDAEREQFSERSASLNQAAQGLKNPVTRLRHLLELVAPGGRGDAGLDSGLMDLFSRVGSAVQSAEQVLAKKKEATTVLGQALLADEEAQVQEQLQAVLGEITQARDALSFAVEEPVELRALYTRLSFLEKWENQVQGKLLGLIAG